jgi:hypothetical protein
MIAKQKPKYAERKTKEKVMPGSVPYADKKPDIMRVLKDTARRRTKITYGNLGKLVGIPPQGPWKPLLDEIGRDQMGSGLPDISYLVVASDTGYPSQIEFGDARKPTPEQKRKADHVIKLVYDAYDGSQE